MTTAITTTWMSATESIQAEAMTDLDHTFLYIADQVLAEARLRLGALVADQADLRRRVAMAVLELLGSTRILDFIPELALRHVRDGLARDTAAV